MMHQIQTIYQNDPLWKDVPLGNQDVETIGSWGGLLTAITMIVNSAGYDETPASMNEKLKAGSGFFQALVIPAVIPNFFPKVRYRGFVACENSAAPLARIDAALDIGQPVIVQVDWNPGAGINTHWVLVKDKSDDDYVIVDPFRYRGDAPDKELLLTQRYKHRGTGAEQVITAVLWLEYADIPEVDKDRLPHDEQSGLTLEDTGQAMEETDTTLLRIEPVEEVQTLCLVPTVDGVAFRSAPLITMETQIRRLSVDEQLVPLEPFEQAISKVGVQGLWIRVQDQNGQVGYVAAWYVRVPG